MKRPILKTLIVFICCGEFSCTSINSSDSSKLSWDFTKQKVYVYSYSKKQDTKNKSGINNNWEQKYMKRDGRFYLQSTNNHFAHLLYPNALTSLSLYNEKTKSIDTMSFLNVGFAKYNIKPNESFIDSDSLILFPQFSKNLKKGSKDTLQTYFKFNSPIANLLAKGYNIVECMGDTIFEKRKCVLFKGKFEISDIVLPKDFSGNLKISRTGNSMYYYDKENHCYLGANISMDDYILVAKKANNANDSDFYLEIKTSTTYIIKLDETKRNVTFMVNPTKTE